MVSANAQYPGPMKQVLRQQMVRQATAGTAQSTIMGKAEAYSRLTEVKITPAVALTGDPTNNRVIKLFNRGQAGAGTTEMATITTTANWTDNVSFTLTLSGTAANLECAPGDILELVETIGGTGVAHGGGQVEVTLQKYG